MPAVYIKLPAEQDAPQRVITLLYYENIDGHPVFTIPHETLRDLLDRVRLTGCEVNVKLV